MSLETMTKLASYTVPSGGVAAYTFSNIPQTYTDLVLKVSLRCAVSGTFNAVYLQVNGDSSASYSHQRFWGYGGVGSVWTTDATLINLGWTSGNTATSGAFGVGELYFNNYTSNFFKGITSEMFSENNHATEVVTLIGNGFYNKTAPITSITVTGETSFMQYSTFTLYGVSSFRTVVGPSLKATGGTLAFDGTYYYHTFSSSEILNVKQPLTNVDFLVVAGGGGGGGGSSGGGGGAGGFRTSAGTSGRGASAESKLTLAPGSYPVVVGGGAAQASKGTDSSFNTVVSLGGGGGGGGQTGGSGGGQSSGGGPAGNYVLGLGTTGQGYDGGAHVQTTYYPGGGGGGAGANGANATSAPASGNGGVGVASSITGVSTYYAGGGGGGGQFSGTAGTGGLGGGGAGSITVNGSNGGEGTGGGGGGAGFDGTGRSGGYGGSGIVVIRYKR
jgi:hypothetical protein